MIYTVVGDIHAKPNNLALVDKLLEKVENMGNPVILLGDVFDTKEVIRGNCLNLVFTHLRYSDLEWTILVGNHDWFDDSCESHSLEVISILPNVTVIGEHQRVGNISLVPYERNLEKLRDVLADIPDGSTVFGHFDTIGFDYGNGFIAEAGLKASEFDRFRLVVSGHYHKFSLKEPLVYLGTPFSHSFGETDQVKYIAAFDDQSETMHYMTTDFPQHRTFEINCDVVQTPFSIDLNDHNRIVLTGNAENILAFDKSPYKDTKWIENPTNDFTLNLDLQETWTNVEQFQKWGQDIKQLKPQTLTLGLAILNEVGASND